MPQSVRFDGALTASMASRSEHLPSRRTSSSLVVLTFRVAAAAALLANDRQATTPTPSAASVRTGARTGVTQGAITIASFADQIAPAPRNERAARSQRR